MLSHSQALSPSFKGILPSLRLWAQDPCFLLFRPNETIHHETSPLSSQRFLGFGSVLDVAFQEVQTDSVWPGAVRAVASPAFSLRGRILSGVLHYGFVLLNSV